MTQRHHVKWWEPAPWILALAFYFLFPRYLGFGTELLITVLFAISLDLALGYAGWEHGQLEQEIKDNAWLTLPFDSALVFDLPPEDRWQAAWGRLGIDVAAVSHTAGHA